MENAETTAQQRARIISEFNTSQPIYKQLPIKVPRGGVIKTLNGYCAHCKSEIQRDAFRGNIAIPFNDGPAIMSAYGFCAPCNTYTPFTQRVRGRYGRLTTEYQNENGEWVWSPWLGGRIDRIRFQIEMWLKTYFGK